MGRCQRVFGYDAIKALAISMVVLYHIDIDLGVCMVDGFYIGSIYKFIYGLLSSSIPLFFMVNGALLRERSLSFRFCIRKSFHLLFIAAIWTLIIRCGFIHFLFDRPQITSISEFFVYYWFLKTLAILYIITWFFQRFTFIRNIVLPFLFVFPFITNFYWDCRMFMNPDVNLPRWGHTGVFTMYSVVYYYVGQFLSKLSNRQSLSKWYSVISILLGLLLVHFEVMAHSNHDHILFDGVNACFPTLGALFISSGIFCIVKDISFKEGWLKSVLSDVGSNTLGIYIFHFFFIVLISECILDKASIPPYLAFIEATLIVFLTTYISKYIMKSPLKFLLKL